jgi:hypothetical protein
MATRAGPSGSVPATGETNKSRRRMTKEGTALMKGTLCHQIGVSKATFTRFPDLFKRNPNPSEAEKKKCLAAIHVCTLSIISCVLIRARRWILKTNATL